MAHEWGGFTLPCLTLPELASKQALELGEAPFLVVWVRCTLIELTNTYLIFFMLSVQS